MNWEVAGHTEQLQISKTKLTNLRRTLQGLEIKLQSQLRVKAALEGMLTETEAHFGAQLAQIQCLTPALQPSWVICVPTLSGKTWSTSSSWTSRRGWSRRSPPTAACLRARTPITTTCPPFRPPESSSLLGYLPLERGMKGVGLLPLTIRLTCQ